MRAHTLWLLGVIACTVRAPTPAPTPVRPGIEVLLDDSTHLIRGKRLALLTNHTGVDRARRRDADRLIAGGYNLTTLFSPEHGFRGLEDRPGLPDVTDSATGLPIYNVYGRSRPAARAALDSVDVLLVDLQDIGARYYTYLATAVSLIRDAARRGKRVVVLDRPNPIGGDLVQGNVRSTLDDPDSSLVGFLPIPMRHGMTLGELIRLAVDLLALRADLSIVPASGWRGALAYDATGLPWINPSPNMPSLESAWHYPGICLFEGTNLSVGRGTGFAFQVVGAPWLDPVALLDRLRGQAGDALAGVAVTIDSFTPRAPTDGKYDGVLVRGLRFRATDRAAYDPTRLAAAVLAALVAGHPSPFQFRPESFDRLAGGPSLRAALEAGRPARDVWRTWEEPLARFRQMRAKYLVY
ncbi:MAG: exo-beta-N-acetylmuramidase NamZ family protein [Gemmatimonadales bacterium]